ncbi:MAG TPA: PHP domain-containing protein [Candidatus Copromorpha excrementigallinarum]|uniref:PHP domain-containing protein n=1 Tax=Candidatus Allocopromorpha excrementigallinarum TaxID=2840742 RepID=A0A9D1L6Y5_9FIRM|nr:PHP domain-containing protein [Candidatus Copromorpha excrementigallinarum]
MIDLRKIDLKKADLHIHTCYSDGQAAPADIVRDGAAMGYEVMAITDHDGTDGVKEALKAGSEEGITVISGIELAAETSEGIGVHILGYGMDTEERRFRKTLEELSEKRARRNRRLLEVLSEMGYPLSGEDLKRQQPNNFIGKPVIARALAAKGYIDNPREAFEEGRLLGSREAKRIKKEKLKTEEAIELIKNAGGEAVMAHPIQTRGIGLAGSDVFYENIQRLAEKMKEAGLSGMECWHPDQSPSQSEIFLGIARRLKLYPTRGSDFHGKYYMKEQG